MKFVQIIEFKTSRIDDFHANLDAWITRTKGNRIHITQSSAGTETLTIDTY